MKPLSIAAAGVLAGLRMVRGWRLLAVACFVLLAASTASAASYTWTGGAAAGQTSDWDNKDNWTPKIVPVEGDDVTIDKAEPHPVLNKEVKVKNLTLTNGGKIEGGTVRVSGLLTMTGGGFVSSTVTANGGMTIGSGGGTSGFASLRGATLTNMGGEQFPAKLSGGGFTLAQNGAAPAKFINNGFFHIGGGAQINREGVNDTSQFINEGTFRSDPNQVGSNIGTVVAAKNDLFFDNRSLVDIEVGMLTFDAIVSSSGEFRSNTPADLNAAILIGSASILELEDNAKLTGSGVIEVNGACRLSASVPAVRFRLKTVGGLPAVLENDFDVPSGGFTKLIVSHTFEWQGSIIRQLSAGQFELDIDGTLNISGDNVIERAAIQNSGTVNVPNGTKITGDGAAFVNLGRVNTTGAQFIQNLANGRMSTFSNLTGGVISNLSGQTTFGWDLVNNNIVETQQGALAITGYVTSTKTFTAGANTNIEFNGDADFNAETRLEGAGLFRANGSGTIVLRANVPVTTFELNSSSKTMSGSTNGRLVVSNLFDWKAGNLNCNPVGTGLLGIVSGATLNISGDTSKTNSGCVIDNGGMANVTTSARFTMDKGATLNNLAGATFNFSSPTNQGVFNENGPTPTFNNAGTVNWGGGSTSPTFSFPFYNQSGGTTNVAPGITLDFYNGSTFNNDFNLGNNGTVRSNNNKTIELKSGHMTTGGIGNIFSPNGIDNTDFFIDINGNDPGLFNINGPYKAGNGTLEFDIRGTGAGTQYDQMNVSGNATLGGTVNIDLQNGFVPQTGTTLVLWPYGSHTGTIGRLNGLNNVGNGRLFLPRYTNTSFNLFTSPINNSQNGPVINSVVTNGGGTTIQGTFSGTPNASYTISIFTNPTGPVSTCDNANQSLVGSTTVATNSSGSANFTVNLTAPLLVGQFVTAIATDASDTSSKFSACAQVTGSGSTVQFSAATTNVGEGDLQVTVLVNRSGNTTAGVTVTFSTSDSAGAQNCNVLNSNASPRCDYITSLSTVQLAAGETSKTVSVLIEDDSYAEGNETFTVSLSDPSGASLGAQSTATVTILDNDSVTGPNPIDQAGFFVRQNYLDFLNRQPDSSGLAFWTNEITSCGSNQSCIEVKRINVSAAFYLSIEFQDTGYLVERLYKTAYGEGTGSSTFGGAHQLPVPVIRLNEFLPDTQKIGNGVIVNQPGWDEVLENNKQTFTAEFVQRSRFITAFPATTTSAQFVATLNSNAGNPLSQSERDQLAGELTSGAKTRAQVLRAVAEHPNLISAEFNRAFVLMQYFGYLRRNPNDPSDIDYTGYDFWLTKLNQFNGNFVNAEMVKAFISAGEYRQRLGP